MPAPTPKPEVVVIGMPSCGKTVFLTVLGKKFTTLVDGKRTEPLGFRLRTCDNSTASVVENAYDSLANGTWPSATGKGQVMPLRWEVCTGRRRIFELFSMDIAGESFAKVFGIKDVKNDARAAEQRGKSAMKTRQSADADIELYHGGGSSRGNQSDADEGGTDYATETLKNAIETAKVVCFMVNIAVPENWSDRDIPAEDAVKVTRFKSSTMGIYLSLRDNPALMAKSIIVLAQAHLHTARIERAGGPDLYLAEQCGCAAAELSNLARENGIPVIAVSAIDERDSGDNELPHIKSPADIQSSGLFGFLLMVSGMAAGSDSIVGVKDAYVRYQTARTEYLRFPGRGAKHRLESAQRHWNAASAFVDACMDYLSRPENTTKPGAGCLDAETLEMYKRCTKGYPEVREALDCEYLRRDEAWDVALRRAAARRPGRSASVLHGIRDEVTRRLLEAYPGRTPGTGFVYGFSEEDVDADSDGSPFDKWCSDSLDEYERDLGADMTELRALSKDMVSRIDSMKSSVGGLHYHDRAAAVRSAAASLSGKLTTFRRRWILDEEAKFPEVDRIGEDLAVVSPALDECDANDAGIRTAREENHKARIRAEESRRRRRRAMLAVLILALFSGAVLFLLRSRLCWLNDRSVETISKAINRSDFAAARSAYGKMRSVPCMLVYRDELLNPAFGERLAQAEALHAARERVRKAQVDVSGLHDWLEETGDSDKLLLAAKKRCAEALAECDALPPRESLADVDSADVDLKARTEAAERCERDLLSAASSARKAKADWEAARRRLAYESELKKARERIDKVSAGADSATLSEVDTAISAMSAISQRLRDQAGADPGDARRADAMAREASALSSNLAERKKKLLRLESERTAAFLEESVSAAEALQAKTSSESDVASVAQDVEECISRLDAADGRLAAWNAGDREMRSRMERRIAQVRSALPTVVQFNGVDRFGAAVDVFDDPAKRGLLSTAPGVNASTGRHCVYLLVNKGVSDEESLLVPVGAKGARPLMQAVWASELKPGMNRIAVKVK